MRRLCLGLAAGALGTLWCLGLEAGVGREIPPPAGGYPLVKEVTAEAPFHRPKPGEALRVPVHMLAEAGSFDAEGEVVMQPLRTERGYEAVYVGIPSKGPEKGARLAVYSIPAERVVTLVEDVNALVGEGKDGKPGQRTISSGFVATRSQKVYFATANAPEPDGYAGGHIIEFDVPNKAFRDVGVVVAGWSVRRLAAVNDNRFIAVVGRTKPQEETKLCLFDLTSGKALDTGVQDVAELWPAGGGAWYLSGKETLLRRWQPDRPAETVAVAPPEGAQEAVGGPVTWVAGARCGLSPGSALLLRGGAGGRFTAENAPAELGAALRMTPALCLSGLANWRWSGEDYPDSPLAKGVLYAARPLGAGVNLSVWAFAEGKLREYGPIADRQTGKAMERVKALTIDGHNDLYVAGLVEGALAIGAIEDVFTDEIIALDDARSQAACAEALKIPVRVKAWSLTGVNAHQDRPYDAVAAASDGTAYCGTMPHHPTQGTFIFRYDPRRDVLENLGDIDEISAEKDPQDVPGMMHSAPVEVGGYMFFTGQDPFYGSANRFPELPKGMRYPGSHVLGYDLKNGGFRDFGIAAPGKSMFWMAADPKRNVLYLRADYERGRVYSMDLATGQVSDTGLDCPTSRFYVAPDGKLYFSEGGNLVSYDPVAKAQAVVIEGGGRAGWIKGQDGQEEPYLMMGGAVQGFNAATKQLRRVGSFPRAAGRLGGDTAYRNGVVYQATGRTENGVWAFSVRTLRIADGEVKDHGILVDQKGRIANEINAIAAGPDGTVYMAGQFWPKPGDPYAPRLRPPYRNLADNCFMVVKGLRP